MFWLILGLLLWSFAHYFKRLFPDARARLTAKLGKNGAQGVIALTLVLSVILMIIGFRSAGTQSLYSLPYGLHYLAMGLNFVGIVFMGAANSKSRLRGVFRHNMLMGLIILSIGHLLTSGQWRVIVLWGGMIVYSLIQMRLINKAEPNYTPYRDGTVRGDVILLAISSGLTIVIVGVHYWLLGH